MSVDPAVVAVQDDEFVFVEQETLARSVTSVGFGAPTIDQAAPPRCPTTTLFVADGHEMHRPAWRKGMLTSSFSCFRRPTARRSEPLRPA